VIAIVYSQGVQDAWSKVATFVPKLIAFLIILVVGLLVARIAARLIAGVLEKVGFDKLVEKGGIKKALESSQYDASDLLAKLAYYVIALFTLELAFGVFGSNPISALLTRVVAFLPKLFVAIIIVVVAGALAAAARELIKASVGGLSYGPMLANVAGTTIVVIGFFAALDELKVAPNIVTGLFDAVLAIVAGSAIVAIGGSGIQPLRQYWERSLSKMEEESKNIKSESQGAGDRIKDRAQELKGQAQTGAPQGGQGGARPMS